MIHVYAATRARWARRELDWRETSAIAYLIDTTHVVDLEADTNFTAAEKASQILASVTLTNKTVDAISGWCAADPLVFVGLVVPRPCGQVVIADLQNQPLLQIEFPLLPVSDQPDNYSVLWAQRGPGWFRL